MHSVVPSQDTLAPIGDYIRAELTRAMEIHPEGFNSPHEGFAVILEEVDELWELVRAKRGHEDYVAMKDESIQIAAMCIRFLLDICQRRGVY